MLGLSFGVEWNTSVFEKECFGMGQYINLGNKCVSSADVIKP